MGEIKVDLFEHLSKMGKSEIIRNSKREIREKQMALEAKWANRSTICAGICMSALALGLGLCTFFACKESNYLERNRQKYIEFKKSTEYVEKISETIEQIAQSSIKDVELKNYIAGTVLNEEYTEKLYQKSLTSADREEIRDNVREAELCANKGKSAMLGGAVLSAMGFVGLLGCNYMSASSFDNELGDL